MRFEFAPKYALCAHAVDKRFGAVALRGKEVQGFFKQPLLWGPAQGCF